MCRWSLFKAKKKQTFNYNHYLNSISNNLVAKTPYIAHLFKAKQPPLPSLLHPLCMPAWFAHRMADYFRSRFHAPYILTLVVAVASLKKDSCKDSTELSILFLHVHLVGTCNRLHTYVRIRA